jgi:hypothetical protein
LEIVGVVIARREVAKQHSDEAIPCHGALFTNTSSLKRIMHCVIAGLPIQFIRQGIASGQMTSMVIENHCGLRNDGLNLELIRSKIKPKNIKFASLSI